MRLRAPLQNRRNARSPALQCRRSAHREQPARSGTSELLLHPSAILQCPALIRRALHSLAVQVVSLPWCRFAGTVIEAQLAVDAECPRSTSASDGCEIMNGRSVSAATRLENLSKERQELVKLLCERRIRDAAVIAPRPRVSGSPMPTSWGQQRLWFIDQLAGGSAGYTVLLAMRLQGELDQGALQDAFAAIVRRHEVLRTVFESVDGEPTQRILPQGSLPLWFVDLSGQDRDSREAQIRCHQMEEAHTDFDLRLGPLVRGRLLRLGSEEHVLLVTMHHIIADGWSKGVFVRELAEFYRAHKERGEVSLGSLPIQYADYAEWQRQQMRPGVADKQLTYWREQLEGAPPQLELPTDRPRPASRTNRGETVPVVIDAALATKLRGLAQRYDMTLFMVLLAGWAALLSRLSGQDDVSIGTPVANRQRPEVEGLIGLFVNTLVLRIGVRPDLSLKDLLYCVKEVTLGAYDHQDVPFEKVVEALQPNRSLSRSPLFQVMFVLHNWPNAQLRLPGLTATMEGVVDEPAILDLWVALEERGDEIVGGINYALDLFDRETIMHWSECFIELLDGMAQEKYGTIGELPVLSEEQQRLLVESFNATDAVYPREKLIHELVEEQAVRTPQAAAIRCKERLLTYADMNGRANKLARCLRDLGVGPGDLVALCVGRGVDMVVGLLAILKTGAAYVPLDPDFPKERIGYMLEDAAPKVLLTQSRLQDGFPNSKTHLISLDSDWDGDVQSTDNILDSHLRFSRLAYVIYTSGSTGRPKGVMVEHVGVVNLLTSMRRATGIEAGDRLLAVTTPAFDIAALELFMPLICGACVVIATRDETMDPAGLAKVIEESDITLMQATPATWRMLIESGWGGSGSLRALCGGEALASVLASQLVEKVRELWNVYGPTETTIWSTFYKVDRLEDIESVSSLPIGRPIANTRIHVLDEHHQLVPVGVRGEIYIGGSGVARGYLNRPELTAERFIPDPFSTDDSARLYRTGDIGKWRSDGTIEYLGRNDQQIKLRGFRVELGEIETLLQRHPRVRQAVVVVHTDPAGDQKLVAYVSQRDENTASADELRTYLSAILPGYMVPGAFVVVERLPLTPNGKVDRRALPLPDPGAYAVAKYDPPQGEVEQTLAIIWQELLGVQRVGRQDNFFELGGHSLIGMKLIARIAEQLAVRLVATSVFQYPTVSQLAGVVEGLRLLGDGPTCSRETAVEEGII